MRFVAGCHRNVFHALEQFDSNHWKALLVSWLTVEFYAVRWQSALFKFESFLTVVLLVICTCTFIKIHFPKVLEKKTGFRGFFWKAARIGERLSPWMAGCCLVMGVSTLFL